MEVRRALPSDIPEILGILEEHHGKSNMQEIPFVRTDVLQVLNDCFSTREAVGLVAEDREGKINGVLFGAMQPFFINMKRCWATDYFFIANGGGYNLLCAFKDWAYKGGASRIIMGVSSGDARADHLLELSGFERTGGMYVIRC